MGFYEKNIVDGTIQHCHLINLSTTRVFTTNCRQLSSGKRPSRKETGTKKLWPTWLKEADTTIHTRSSVGQYDQLGLILFICFAEFKVQI